MFLLDLSSSGPEICWAGAWRYLRQRPGFALGLAASAFAALLPAGVRAQNAPSPVLLDAMTAELHRAFTSLGRDTGGAAKADQANQLPPYFLSYSVTDADGVAIQAQYGALVSSGASPARVADIQVRLGSPALDNTHGTHRGTAGNSAQLPLADDRAAWEQRVAALSKVFREYPDVYQNLVALSVQNETDYFVSSEGSRVVTPHVAARLVVLAVTRADDGMDLFRAQTFEAETADGLPNQAELESAIRDLAKSLEALRKAPVTQPFDGPAILSGRAAAVFFHEVLGHRLEGQRQRGDEEGQTFTKDIGKEILPSFLSVSDDPTETKFGNTWLSGSYDYDDEGQKARRVDLIQDGVLKTFLMSRLPIASFGESNGHGRAQVGRMPTGRQGNLIVTSTKSVPEAELRKELIGEAKKQGKPYGLYFEDISSGFAVTTRNSPQAFQVIPLVVYRVYVDGRPDELVRGVSIVGTPLAALKRIIATGDKPEVFNGECGAESGTVPVSAVAPAMLVSEMETQRQPQGTARPPILPIPQGSGTRDQGSTNAAGQKESK